MDTHHGDGHGKGYTSNVRVIKPLPRRAQRCGGLLALAIAAEAIETRHFTRNGEVISTETTERRNCNQTPSTRRYLTAPGSDDGAVDKGRSPDDSGRSLDSQGEVCRLRYPESNLQLQTYRREMSPIPAPSVSSTRSLRTRGYSSTSSAYHPGSSQLSKRAKQLVPWSLASDPSSSSSYSTSEEVPSSASESDSTSGEWSTKSEEDENENEPHIPNESKKTGPRQVSFEVPIRYITLPGLRTLGQDPFPSVDSDVLDSDGRDIQRNEDYDTKAEYDDTENDEYDSDSEEESDDGIQTQASNESILPTAQDQSKDLTPVSRTSTDKGIADLSLTFRKIANLSQGNETTSLDLVQSSGKCWILKKCTAVKESYDESEAYRALSQLQNEVIIYRRIEQARRENREGFEFVMNMAASLTLEEEDCENGWDQGTQGYLCLLLPCMSKDLYDFQKETKDGILPQSDVRRILAQSSTAIAMLHKIGVMHLDIKPENILLDSRGNIRIADFGLSKRVGTLHQPLIAGRKYAQDVVGTRGFWAPEVLKEDGYGLEADYWSLGCVLLELVSGQGVTKIVPFDDCKKVKKWASSFRNSGKRKRFLSATLAKFEPDQALIDLVVGLLDPNPETRFQFEHIRKHQFFFREDGVSEFCEMLKTSQSRPEESIKVVEKEEWTNIYYRSEPSNGSCFRWVNPSYVADLMEDSL